MTVPVSASEWLCGPDVPRVQKPGARARPVTPLMGQVAVVTGGSGAIGGGIALALADAGAAVVVHFNRDACSPGRVVRSIRRRGGRALAVQGDLVDRNQVLRLLEVTIDQFGHADALVNNAAVPPGADLWELGEDEWDHTIAVNLKAAVLCAQAFGLHMHHRRTGRIVNIASTAGVRPLPGAHAYVAAKAALIGVTRSLAMSLAPHVTVNSVVPGFVDTFPPGARLSPWWKSVRRAIPARRLATVQDVAHAVRFLIAEAAFITGQALIVDGGATLTPPVRDPGRSARMT